jgi:hypothetical protein
VRGFFVPKNNSDYFAFSACVPKTRGQVGSRLINTHMKNQIQITAAPTQEGYLFKITAIKTRNSGKFVTLANSYGFAQTFGVGDTLVLANINDLLSAGIKIVLTA